MAPVVGSVLTEIVNHVIPEQRTKRLETYLAYLNGRIDFIDNHAVRSRLTTPESIELFEEGAMQAARALSEERRAHIARLVAFGMTGDEKDKIEAKRLLKLFGEIDDDEVIILTHHHHKFNQEAEFKKKHANILDVEMPSINSTSGVREKYAISKMAKDHLVRLGLLSPQFGSKRDELPEFDYNTGTLKVQYYRLGSIGRLLLIRLGVVDRGTDFGEMP